MDKDRLERAVVALKELVSRLRGPGGCPWDACQTEDTIRMYLLEEAYEVVDAVESGSPEEICGELGDLLFQIVFLAELGEEQGTFDLVDVVERITKKMIHRHPHVFGTVRAETAEEVAENWARLKRKEREKANSGSSEIDSVPENLPALLRAHRLIQRAAKRPRGSVEPPPTWQDVVRDVESLGIAFDKEEDALVENRLGKLLFDLAGVAGRRGWNAEDLLRQANRRFIECLDGGKKAASRREPARSHSSGRTAGDWE